MTWARASGGRAATSIVAASSTVNPGFMNPADCTMARPMRRWLVASVLVLAALPLTAQRGFRRVDMNPLVPDRYDGRFVLARLYYGMYPGWSYDWPDMEDHLNQILGNLTTLRVQPRRNNILRMDDPELFKYPVAYLSEPGFWFPTDSEARSLREWFGKG